MLLKNIFSNRIIILVEKGNVLSVLSYFAGIKKELDKKISFYNQSSSTLPTKKPSSVDYGICFDNGAVKLIRDGKDFDDSERNFLFANYKEVSIWVEIVYSGIEATLRFQYYRNEDKELLYYGPYIFSNKCSNPAKCNNLQRYSRLFKWFCTNKPALIRYSDFHYDKTQKNLIPRFNMVKLVIGNQKALFHTHCWLFAEYMDWMMSSIKGLGGQYTSDDVANWMYFGWTLI